MNADALAMLKEAALKKKKAFKEPVVKNRKVTREQYLQEKAEEEAKKNKKKAFLQGTHASDEDPTTAPVAQALQTLQRERAVWQREKQEIIKEFQETKAQMTGKLSRLESLANVQQQGPSDEIHRVLKSLQNTVLALQNETADLKLQVQTSEEKIRRLKKDISNSETLGSSTSRSSSQPARVSELDDRIDVLEEDMVKLRSKMNPGSSLTSEKLDSLNKLEARVTALEVAHLKTAVENERSRGKSRARSTTRRTNSESNPNSPSVDRKASSQNSRNSDAMSSALSAKVMEKEAGPASTTTAAVSDAMPGSENAAIHDFLVPHTADEIAKAQARDDKLVSYLENPGKGSAKMYPKFSMAVKNVDGVRLVFFYKKVYLPSELRQATLKHYYHKYPESWTKFLCKHVIWPSLDADITSFKL